MDRIFEWDDRKFAAHFGIAKETMKILWLHIQSLDTDGIFKLKHLLWTLYFMKVYNSSDVSASFWKVDPKTYSKWVWKLIVFLNLTLNTVCINNITNNIELRANA